MGVGRQGVTADVARAVEGFLYHEATLLDEGRLDDWLDLFTEDCRYWVPCNDRDLDPATRVSLVYDDRAHLADRVFRITSGTSFTQSPPSKLLHSVGNVVVAPVEGDPGALEARSSQVVVELQRGRQTIFAAHCRHRLRADGDGALRIALKRVDLLNLDEPIGSLTFIL